MHQGLEIIDDVWVVEHACGKGGMGSVFRCHNRDATRILAAIKLLNPALRDNAQARTRFVREAEILFQLNHPHVVKVRNIRLDTERPYMEMEFVLGESLEDLLKRGPLGPRAVPLAIQLASALAYLHERGIYHRDLKPSNILLEHDGGMKIVDFGLAVESNLPDEDRITEAGTAFGTVSYAPPEWITPDKLDPASWDLYGLGVVLYEAFTGKVAFPMPSDGGVRRQIVAVMTSKQSAAPLDPGDVAPWEVRQLIVDLTRLDPAGRPRSAVEVLERLGQVVPGGIPGHLSIPAISYPAPPEAPAPAEEAAPSRRVPVLALAAVGVAVVVLTAAAVAAGLVMAIVLDPNPRDVEVLVAGVPPGIEVGVRLGGRQPSVVDGLSHRFEGVEVGEATLAWTLGPGCATPCPGTTCPEWCLNATDVRDVPRGSETLVLGLELVPPPLREVAVHVDPAWGPAAVEVDGRAIAGTDVGLSPGPHTLRVQVGECAEGDVGCAARGDCPAGCASWAGDLVVVSGAEPVRFEPPLPEAPSAADRPPRAPATDASVDPGPALDPADPEPIPADPPGPIAEPPTAGTPVNRAAFSAWVADHPEWAREAAISAGRADENYLRPGTLEGEGYVADVSWLAAVAYCSGRGGLASVDAEPHSWAETQAQPFQEWRQHGGNPTWRRFDGERSDAARRTETNAFTGFRCAR